MFTPKLSLLREKYKMITRMITWIHGGTFNFGGIDATYENPDNLVAEHDLIVAKINYRLGQLIFSTFPL